MLTFALGKTKEQITKAMTLVESLVIEFPDVDPLLSHDFALLKVQKKLLAKILTDDQRAKASRGRKPKKKRESPKVKQTKSESTKTGNG